MTLCGFIRTAYHTMHEQTKISEAKYFLARMSALADDRAAFNYNLSAFLAAARSTLQYAHKEAETKPGGQKWYAAQVAAKPVLKFFKDKRDINVHANPVLPSAKIAVSVTETIHLSDSFSATIRRKDGTIEEKQSLASSPPPLPPKETESSVSYQYCFPDWSGSEDVLDLCRSYLTDVDAVVSDGVANGFLTPS